MKVRGKLTLILSVPLFAIAVIIVVGVVSFGGLRQQIRAVNTLETDRAALLRGDRDAYQARFAVNELAESPSASVLEARVESLYENLDELRDGVSGLADRITGSMTSQLAIFETQNGYWGRTADIVVRLARTTTEADWEIGRLSDEAAAAFNSMLQRGDALGELAERVLAGSLGAQTRRAVEDALLLVLEGIRHAYQSRLAQQLIADAVTRDQFDSLDTEIVESMELTLDSMTEGARILGGTALTLAGEFEEYYVTWQAATARILELLRGTFDDRAEIAAELEGSAGSFNIMRDAIARLGEGQDERVAAQVAEMEAAIRRTIFQYIIIALAAVGAAVGIALMVASRLTKPLTGAVEVADRVALGDLDLEIGTGARDETGQLMIALRNMVGQIRSKAEALEAMASGDFTTAVNQTSEVDGLGRSLVMMRGSLSALIGEVSEAADQVAMGSDQIASASQSLSQGATEQASSLEEISSSLTQMTGQSRVTVENADKGNTQMRALVEAIEKINTSSDEIRNVIGVIDDIAFQINLLALNANVEAARAGRYGKGFAVVAEEVRALAGRSAEAVKETTEIVDGTVENIEVGVGLAEETARQLEEMSLASKEQAAGISQIESALGQIDHVTQGNTASAEETAAAASELTSRARELKEKLARFRLSDGSGSADLEDAQGEHPGDSGDGMEDESLVEIDSDAGGAGEVDPSSVISLDDQDFGEF